MNNKDHPRIKRQPPESEPLENNDIRYLVYITILMISLFFITSCNCSECDCETELSYPKVIHESTRWVLIKLDSVTFVAMPGKSSHNGDEPHVICINR